MSPFARSRLFSTGAMTMTRSNPAVVLKNSASIRMRRSSWILEGRSRDVRAARCAATTSGSTGPPASIWRDAAGSRRHHAAGLRERVYAPASVQRSARFSTWLTRIAINEALARVRSRGLYEAFDDDLSNVEPFMSKPGTESRAPGARREAPSLVEWAIDTLPDGMREVSCCVTSRG